MGHQAVQDGALTHDDPRSLIIADTDLVELIQEVKSSKDLNRSKQRVTEAYPTSRYMQAKLSTVSTPDEIARILWSRDQHFSAEIHNGYPHLVVRSKRERTDTDQTNTLLHTRHKARSTYPYQYHGPPLAHLIGGTATPISPPKQNYSGAGQPNTTLHLLYDDPEPFSTVDTIPNPETLRNLLNPTTRAMTLLKLWDLTEHEPTRIQLITLHTPTHIYFTNGDVADRATRPKPHLRLPTQDRSLVDKLSQTTHPTVA